MGDPQTTKRNHTSTTRKKNNNAADSVIASRTRDPRIKRLTTAFECVLENEGEDTGTLEAAGAALAVAAALYRNEGSSSSKKKARLAIDLGKGEGGWDHSIEVDLCMGAAIRSKLWLSTRAYHKLALILKRIYKTEVLPPIGQVRRYELTLMPRCDQLHPSPLIYSRYSSVPLRVWDEEEETPAMRAMFLSHDNYSNKSDRNATWITTTREGTYFSTRH